MLVRVLEKLPEHPNRKTISGKTVSVAVKVHTKLKFEALFECKPTPAVCIKAAQIWLLSIMNIVVLALLLLHSPHYPLK